MNVNSKDTKDIMHIGQRIKKLREALNLTQVAFAEKLGRSKRSIQEWESGRSEPSERILRLIEQTFNVNPSWLREGKGEMFKPKPQEVQLDALDELFKAMERLEGRVPRAVKRAIIRAVETKDIEGIIQIIADYLHDVAEEAKAGTLKIQGNVAIGDSNIQVYKGDKK